MNAEEAYCMSSYLMYRYVFDGSKLPAMYRSNIVDISFPRTPIKNAEDLLEALGKMVFDSCKDRKAALALSGGIDSAILAKFMPKGAKAYTFRCVIPGKRVIDESERARKWAKMNELEHEIIDIKWEDVEQVTDTLMQHKGTPIHSIEAQIYIAALKAKLDGAEKLIFGENADIIYGGMNGLLSKDWLYSEFVDRYTYVMPYKALKEPMIILEPFLEYEKDGHIDGHDFINKYFRQEALGTYTNACNTAGVQFVGPYSMTYLDAPLDYSRVRRGETKYIVREAFRKLYPSEEIPDKIPMPRPVNEWFKEWDGPKRTEFVPHCTNIMTGDQKWMIWCAEKWLNLLDRQKESL